jgi:hypothetical protein
MKNFQRAIIFTKTMLDGSFRYKDLFQILPAKLEGMPHSKMQEHFPVILEFWIDDNDAVVIEKDFGSFVYSYTETATILRKQDMILSLLTVFTNHHFFRYTDFTGSWGMPILRNDPYEEMNSWESKWCLPQFFFPGLPGQLRITEFTTPVEPPILRVNNKLYYVANPNLDFDKKRQITFPALLEEAIDAYFALSSDSQDTVYLAISHSLSAIELRLAKKTLSLLASFTSLKMMVNLEFKDVPPEKCSTCGQAKYSISKKFREFLLKYVATADSNRKKYNDYYTLRSKIVHSGQQVRNETLFSGLTDDGQHKEFITQIEIIQMGKLAIIHWLLINYRNGKPKEI